MDKRLNRFIRGGLLAIGLFGRAVSFSTFMKHNNNKSRLAHIATHLSGEVLLNEANQALDDDYTKECEKEKLFQSKLQENNSKKE
jgi:hypothetical protein